MPADSFPVGGVERSQLLANQRKFNRYDLRQSDQAWLRESSLAPLHQKRIAGKGESGELAGYHRDDVVFRQAFRMEGGQYQGRSLLCSAEIGKWERKKHQVKERRRPGRLDYPTRQRSSQRPATWRSIPASVKGKQRSGSPFQQFSRVRPLSSGCLIAGTKSNVAGCRPRAIGGLGRGRDWAKKTVIECTVPRFPDFPDFGPGFPLA